KKAREALIRAQDRVQTERLKRKDLYCLFQYLAAELSGEAGERENAEALAHRYFAEGTDSPLLYLMEFCLDPANASDAFRAQAFLKDAYAHDIRAAWVLQEAAYLWMKGGVEIPLLTGFELKATLYGIRKGILTEQKVFEILSAEMTDPKLLNLYMTVLKTGFLRYGNREFLQAIVNVYMQQKAADTVSLPWYRAAVSEELSIPGLYEYYLASLPKDSTDPIPEHMIRYFGMGSTAAGTSYAVLYLNVLKYYREDEEILGMYDRRIREYAYRRLKREEFARHELPLYVYILEKEGVTQENALYLKPLFYLTEVRTGEARASRVVLHYPELSRETSFPLVQGKALFPVYTREAVIALENSRGNRIADPRLQAEKVFDYPEYRRQCALLTPPTILQKLSDIEEKALAGNVRDSDVILLTDLIKDRNLNPFFRDRLYEMLIDMNERRELSHMDCTQFLMEADPSAFRRPYLLKLTGLLVSKGYYRVAYQRVMDYGPEGIPGDTLYELAVRMLGEPVLEGSETLKCLLYMLSESGRADGRILDYLARYFNGTSAQMEKLSKAVRRKRVPSYDLYERTLTVCFYTGKDRDIDTLFGWYVGQNMQNETLRHAYLVYRAHTYFKHGKKLTDVAAEALKKEAAGLPDVCLMACLTWLAEHADSLTEDDKALAEDLLCRAVRKNIFLGCFEKFENTVKIPAEMEGRVYLEYRSDTAKEVSVIGQILPERHYFHGAMKPVYPGVYVRTFILYPREWIQFYYNVREEDGSVSETEGPLVFRDEVKAAPGSLYDDVLATEEKLSAGDPAGTAAYLRDLVAKRKMIDHLFTEDT
ncbi:MAG: hypothetical protein J6U26_05785, partial [Lachnospiraceae bacterium]|nr:hypothetical protein [Lachnospiraceae bacterium]